MNNLREKRLKL